MNAIAVAHKQRSLKAFESALETYTAEIGDDPLVKSHLGVLYDTMLQQNLCKLIEPFSRVEIAHVAKLIDLDQATVEKKCVEVAGDGRAMGGPWGGQEGRQGERQGEDGDEKVVLLLLRNYAGDAC